MPLSPGTRLGPYEILSPLGAGGMGEVFRARDTRLGREVALKVLSGEFSEDSARRSRFEQEARAAAALNHPNIVGLYDVGTESGVAYLVSELVVGETLTNLIERGPVPTRQLIDIAVQIADGMAAAHAARITHRDLKPANIMLTADGRAKILDFGLAKQAVIPSSSPDETPTVHQTQAGAILGTVHYMSPEQARGKPADHRSDQFSFGLIVYEMATGRKAFDKPETVQTMSAILTEDAPPLDANVPAPLRWVIGRCLAKDPAGRYESSRDLYQELRSLRDHFAEASTTQAPLAAAPRASVPRRRLPWLWIAAGLAALIAAFAAGLLLSGDRFPDQAAYRFTPFAFAPGGQDSPVWSPDGKAVAYSASPGASWEANQVFVRYLDSPTPAQVTHIAHDATPLVWAPDGKRILFRTTPAAIWSVSVVGGEPELVMSLNGGFAAAVSPDLRTVAMVARGEDDAYAVWFSSPPGAPRQKYLPDPVASKTLYNDTRMSFSPDGKSLLLIMKGDRNQTEMWRMPYPPGASTPARRVLPDVNAYGGTPYFSWMPDNRRIVLSLSLAAGAPRQLWLADLASGKNAAFTSGTTGRTSLAVSPDGHRIVFTELTGNYDVVSVDLEHAIGRRLIATERTEYMPAWAVRQPILVYVTNRNGPEEIWLHGPAGEDRPLVSARDFPPGSTQWYVAPALSPDGDRVIYSRLERDGRSRLWISAVSGGSPVPLTNDETSAESAGSWSYDSNWFAYLANRNGKRDLMKVKTTGQATPVLVKSPGGPEPPSWSPAGDWIVSGNELVSPDGSQSHPLGDHHTLNYAFSRDGKLLYGLRAEGDRTILFSVDPASGSERILGDLGADYAPAGSFHPGMRFSLAPDGKSLAFTSGRIKSNLWMLDGFAP